MSCLHIGWKNYLPANSTLVPWCGLLPHRVVSLFAISSLSSVKSKEVVRENLLNTQLLHLLQLKYKICYLHWKCFTLMGWRNCIIKFSSYPHSTLTTHTYLRNIYLLLQYLSYHSYATWCKRQHGTKIIFSFHNQLWGHDLRPFMVG